MRKLLLAVLLLVPVVALAGQTVKRGPGGTGSGVTLAADGEVDAAKAVNAADPRINAATEDVLVDLDAGINRTTSGVSTIFANPWAQLQDAVNPYLLDPSAPRVVRCVGRGTADLSDLRAIRYFNGTSDVQATMDAGLVIAKASSIGVDGMPVINGEIAGGSNFLTFISDGCRIAQDMTGQTRPAVGIYRGGGFFGGKTGGKLVSRISDVIDDRGSFTIARTGAIVDGGWTPGRPIVMDGTTYFNSPTTFVYLWEDGVQRGNCGMSWRFFGISGVDDDDIGILRRDTWGCHLVTPRVQNVGVGLQAYSNTRGSVSSGYIAQNGANVVAGDPVNGCGNVYDSACAGTTCTADATTTWCSNLAFTNATVLEGASTGSQFVAYGAPNSWEFNGAHFESGSTINTHQILLGAGVCDSGTRANLSCGTDSDCGSSGEVCDVAVTAFGKVSFRDIDTPSRKANETFRGMFLGKGMGSGTFAMLLLERVRVITGTAAAEDNKVFGYHVGLSTRVSSRGTTYEFFPRRYPGYVEEPTRWCNWTFIADSSGDVATGEANCSLDTTVFPLEVQCMTTGGTAAINIEDRTRTGANSAGTDILLTDLSCSTTIARREDDVDPGVASLFTTAAQSGISGSHVFTPTITSETLAAGEALRIGIRYMRRE